MGNLALNLNLLVCCGWCGCFMGWKDGTGISHGLCDDCRDKYFPKSEKE